ncbi:hypothetical protein P154DRAFT_603374 [Amniculicola lignicola CBS 123094]|uniref:Cohesin loading factor-domain-containing protein n=1 Tax=Amniculicola lignicola CBS 123094 TaxID=1392246 RepID=A0A6A5WWH8_9PLEO|nr:hypothetical protein P154DRAFT_603374 [Amniculicola lignicola CBS 123094]
MDPRYPWNPQGYANGQYGPPPPAPPPNGYAPNGYQMPYSQQPMPQMYPPSQPMQGQPRVVVPPRPTQYGAPMDDMRAHSRMGQPQVVIPPRNPNTMAQMANPKIRQVQVQVPVSQRGNSSGGPGNYQQQQAQTPVSKPVHRSQSFQENSGMNQQRRTPSIPTPQQHRTPLQPQSTPQQQRTHSSQASASQQRPPQQRPPQPQTPSQVRHPQVIIRKPASHSTPTSTRPPPTPSKALPTDLSVLLLSAADEYINAARDLGAIIALKQRHADLTQYYKLMALGLGCMETVLKEFNLVPKEEAKLRLRYASLLIEETNNPSEIEACLTKGIALCDRSRLVDLKYSMQHLQARYQFQTNHRAALKSLDAPISEAETFQHIPWVYAFRFLKASLALQVPGRPETSSALQQLHAISEHAGRHSDHAIFVTCSTWEALIHLRNSGPDHIEHAQRAIASARSLQLQVSPKRLGQIATLVDVVDIACSLQQGWPNEAKVSALQKKMDDATFTDGVFSVLIERSFGGSTTIATGDIFRKAQDGRDQLTLSWLPKQDVGLLSYYLSGMSRLSTEAELLDKAIRYLNEGHNASQMQLNHPTSRPMSVSTAIKRQNQVSIMDWHITFALGIHACFRENRTATKNMLKILRGRVSKHPFKNNGKYKRLLSYLAGTYYQSGGAFDSALAAYTSPTLALPETAGSANDFDTDIAILATMNRMMILQNPAHPQHYLAEILFVQLEPFCISHTNRQIDGAFRIFRGLHASSELSLNRQKTFFHNAMNAAQSVKNSQFLSICLTGITDRFYKDSIDAQAVKSARAARQVTKLGRINLWRAVAAGLCVHIFQRNGLESEALEALRGIAMLMETLPPPLKGEPVVEEEDLGVEGVV